MSLIFMVGCEEDTPGPDNGNGGGGPSVPRVFTNAISNVTDSSAVSGGFVLDEGSASVTVRGVCFSTETVPELEDECTEDGSGSGEFTSLLTDLEPETVYYVRAYATNSRGTGYGDQEVFETEQSEGGTPRERVSHSFVQRVTPSNDPGFAERSYPVVQADWDGIGGDKRWTGMNLGATEEPASPTDTREETVGWYFQFNLSRGFVYQGGQVTPEEGWFGTIGVNDDWGVTTDPCRLLLEGNWRIPTAEEWDVFRTALAEQGGMGDGNLEDAFNSTLRLHAAGLVDPVSRDQRVVGSHGYYWSKTQEISIDGIGLFFDSSASSILTGSKAYGMPVRCIEGD
ncbi:MAG: hypothetical protein WD355_03860 [Balneolaceae bacterium]